MSADDPLSRREFLASSSVALGAGALCDAEASAAPGPPARLALHGGEKAVGERMPKLVHWGGPEKERLDAMIGQDTLFYWKGPQTSLLLERFRKMCSLPHVMSCSSGTAALHIAVAAAGIGLVLAGQRDDPKPNPIAATGKTVTGPIHVRVVDVQGKGEPPTSVQTSIVFVPKARREAPVLFVRSSRSAEYSAFATESASTSVDWSCEATMSPFSRVKKKYPE